MNPDKAIKILSDVAKSPLTAIRLDFPKAAQLGIEALERIKQERNLHTYPAYKLLPGETRN